MSETTNRRPLWRGALGGVLGAACLMAVAVPGTAQAAPEHERIARGSAVPDGTHPWAVSLHRGATPSTANTQCSGSHVAPGWVLTAQHCFDSDLDGVIEPGELAATSVYASLGRTRISDTSRGEVLRGSQVHLLGSNDLALLKLAAPSSAPVVQLASALPASGTNVTTAGWGYVDDVGTLPDRLQQGSFRITGSSAVDVFYRNNGNEEMCGGDSGGPVFTQIGGRVLQVGVHTNSPRGCGVRTGDATGSRVDHAYNWIKARVTPAFGFVWADNPTAASYTPQPAWSHNSAGGTNTITRSGTGAYRVDLPHLGEPGGNVQVTAYGSTSNRCSVAAWVPSGSTQRVHVRCVTAAGKPADTRFVAQYYRAGVVPQQSAYLWAHAPTSPSYTPSPAYSYNSRGGTNTVSRSSTGVYTASLPGLTAIGGNVAVTAYGSGSAHCKVSSWASGTTVGVRCFDAFGRPADSAWSLRYTDQSVANAGQKGAYLWANEPTSASYTPSATYRYSSAGTTPTAFRSGVGQYRVTLPGMPASNRTSVMVTGYGSDSSRCSVVGWGGSSSSSTASVECRTSAGSPADARFTLSHVTNL